MHPAAACLGLASLGAVAFAHRGKELSALSLAWAMVSLWAAANLASQAWRIDWIVALDLPVAMMAYSIWYGERQRWQRALVDIFIARFVLHVAYPGPGTEHEVLFLHLLNAMFLAGCFVIASKGVSDAVGSSNFFRRFPRLHAFVSCRTSSLAQSETLK